jgi:hypothetical protein
MFHSLLSPKRVFRGLLFGLLLGLGLHQAPALAGPTSFARPTEAVDAEGALSPLPEPPAGWKSQRGVYAQVHTDPADVAQGRRLLQHAEAAVPRLAAALGLAPGRTIEIYLSPDQKTFDTMQPGEPPGWADGTAWPSRGLIYLRSPRVRPGDAAPLEQVLDHELVHIILGRAFLPRAVPRWLQEGAAQLFAGEIKPEMTERIGLGMLTGGLIPLEDLTRGFPDDPLRAQLAYAESADFVAWLKSTYGEEALHTVILGLSQGRPPAATLREATGKSLQELNDEWRDRLSASGLWLRPLVSDSALFGVGAVLMVLGYLRKRKKSQDRMERWTREDALQDKLERDLSQPWTMGPPPRALLPTVLPNGMPTHPLIH